MLEVRAGRTTLRLAVAATPAQREHGLMNVPFVPSGQGMLFAFPGADEMRGFWMKDTITPLDMVFVRSDGTIVDDRGERSRDRAEHAGQQDRAPPSASRST